MSLFENIGGSAAVDAAVDIFYRKVLADDSISMFFDSVDMAGQHTKQKAFLTMVFGGPNSYSGKDLREGHKSMNLTEAHFAAVGGHLQATLEELSVPKEYIDEVMGIVVGAKSDILNL